MLCLLALLLAATACGSAGVILEHDLTPTVVSNPLGHLSVDRDALYDGDVKTEAEFLRRLGFVVRRFDIPPPSLQPRCLLPFDAADLRAVCTKYLDSTAK